MVPSILIGFAEGKLFFCFWVMNHHSKEEDVFSNHQQRQIQMSYEKDLVTFYSTGWLIGIFIMENDKLYNNG